MNIAKILKNAPEGTKLYSPIFGDVILIRVVESNNAIFVRNIEGEWVEFSSEGIYDVLFDGECLLFPSRTNRDWNTFKIEQAFPMNYKDCCSVIGWAESANKISGYKHYNLYGFQKLLVCRDAWWKIDNKWEPDWDSKNTQYLIKLRGNDVTCIDIAPESSLYDYCNSFLTFRTEEIRNKFYENFKDLIEECKEFI